MSPDEFRIAIGQRSDDEMLPDCLFDDSVPFVCADAASWQSFRDELIGGLGVTQDDVRVVGSGRLGFSLKPGANLRAFRDQSDVDVAIVNADLFDRVWMMLLDAAYPRAGVAFQIGGWLGKRKNEVYTGWLSPGKIRLDVKIFGERVRPILTVSQTWFDTLKKASQRLTRRHENIGGRLYRTWDHARLYHRHSIAELRKTILP